MTAITKHITGDRLTGSTEGIEKSVLGCILVDNSRALEVDIKPYMFPNWGRVAEAMFSEIDKAGSVDVQTLAYECVRLNICSKGDIHSLIGAMVQVKFEDHAATLRKEWIRREEIEIHREAIARLESGEGVHVVLAAAEAMREVIQGNGDDENESRVRKAGNFIDDLYKRQRGEIASGYKIGIPQFDKLTMGLGLRNRYRVWGARPGMGKTTFVYQCAIAIAEQGCPVLVVSLEMTFAQMLEVVVEQRTGISRADMNTPHRLSKDQLQQIQQAVEWFYELPIYIEDQQSEWSTIKNRMRYYVKKYGVKQIFIDYLQLMTDRSQNWRGNKNAMVEHISRGVSNFARIESSDVIALSQLSRAVETRGGDKRPQMSDLRDSGAVEQDAGQIGFIYRPEYYNILEDEEGHSLRGVMEFDQQKDRYANQRGKARMWYEAKYNKYGAISPGEDNSTEPYNPQISAPAQDNNDNIPF